MYAQFQRVHIQKYNYYVLYFIKLVKNKVKLCLLLYIYLIYIFCNVVVCDYRYECAFYITTKMFKFNE